MIAFFLLLIIVGLYSVFRYRRRRLYELAAAIKGPRSLPVLGIAHRLGGSSEDTWIAFSDFTQFAIKNNGIAKIWLGPQLYFVSVDPTDLEVILKTSLEKDDVHRFVWDFLGYGTGFAPVSVWRPRRKIMVPAFSPKIVDSFLETFAKHSHKLTHLLDKRDDAGVFDLWPFISTYALDSVCENVMGINLKAQENPDNPVIHLLAQAMNLICKRMRSIWLHSEWLFRLSPMYAEYQECVKKVHAFADSIVKTKRQNMDPKGVENETGMDSYKRQTFLELLINSSGGTKGYSDIELREESLALCIAGTDTSAACIGFTLKLLAMYPDVQENVHQELYDVFGDSDRLLVKDDLLKLPCLERVIKESLRLYPPAPYILRKISTEIKLPSGNILPAGCGVVVSIAGAQRDPRYWGPDVEEFNPDRFLPEKFNLTYTCSYMPFSNGPRNCIGYQYALMSLKAALSTILRRHRMVAEPQTSRAAYIPCKFEIMLKPVNGYQVAIERRTTANVK